MGHTRYEPAFASRRPWNDGRMVGAKKSLKPKDVTTVRLLWGWSGTAVVLGFHLTAVWP